MEIPRSRRPYEKYYHNWVVINSMNGNYTVTGYLRGSDEEGLILNPYEFTDWNVDRGRRKVLESSDLSIPLTNVGYIKSTTLKQVLHFIWFNNKEMREPKEQPQKIK